jgi:hypothetical protein
VTKSFDELTGRYSTPISYSLTINEIPKSETKAEVKKEIPEAANEPAAGNIAPEKESPPVTK